MALSVQQFIDNLSQTGLMSAAEVSTLCERLPPEQRPADGGALAKLLIRQGKLTKYQAQVIYSGKHQNLVFGEYVILDKLGAGGMGVVLKAQHRRMKRAVAIKILPAATMKNQAAIDRFYREVEAAAKLMHPNIVAAHDAGEHQGMHYLVMEFVDGKDLGQILAESGPLPIEPAIDYILQAAKGLEFAHARGVVHRDIKPANLLLSSEGQIKILDMGLARLSETPGAVEATAGPQLTHSGQMMGTVDYMSPEQAMDTRTADHRADIYALGCTLFKLLTGRSLFDGDTMMKKLVAHREQPPPSIRERRPDVPEALDDVFQQMVAKRPEDRYQSMEEVLAALETCQEHCGGSQEHRGRGIPSPTSRRKDSPPTEGSPLTAGAAGGTSQSKNAIGVTGVGAACPDPSHPVPGRATPAPKTATAPIRKADHTAEAPTLASSHATVDTDPQTQITLAAAVVQDAKTSARRINRRFGPKTLVAGVGVLILAAAACVILVRTAAGPQPPLAVAPFDAAQAKAHQEAWAKHLGVKVEYENSLGMKFVLIPPGEFLMGSTADEIDQVAKLAATAKGDALNFVDYFDAQAPQHSVRITRAFYLGATEVTAAQYDRFLVANGKAARGGDGPLPAGSLSWDDAVEFCRWLGKAENQTYRLPTEAEWEYSCRAGTTTAFSFGDALSSDLANFDGRFPFGTTKKGPDLEGPTRVGTYPANPFGLFDMHGNQWEWCQDYFARDYYQFSVTEDPGGPSTGTRHVLHGGDWEKSHALVLRSAHRYEYGGPFSSVGFRCVRVLDVASAKAASATPSNKQPATPPRKEPKALAVGTKAGDEWSGNGLAMKFCWCPPGDFKMGEGKEAVDVKLTRGFWLGKYEVTQAEFRQVMKSNPSHFAATGAGKEVVAGLETDKFPVEQVSREEAAEFCRALTEQEKLAGRLPQGWEYRLPTQTQWEYACRAGTQTVFSFGDQESVLSEYAWHAGNSEKRTHEVGQKRANPWGLHDMHGNIWEWCRDSYQEKLPGGSDPQIAKEASNGVLRGGGWDRTGQYCHSVDFLSIAPDSRSLTIGFRVAAVQVIAPTSATPLSVGTKAGQEWSGNGLSMKFCWCPPGEFKMGDAPNQVDVKLTRGFWLGKYEVTQGEYRKLTKGNPSYFSTSGGGKDAVVGLDDTDKFPVETVTWDDATKSCGTLSEQEQRAGRLPGGWEYRLPTEAQWEYACRAGTQTAYSYGDVVSRLGDHAWHDGNSEKRTHEVGQKPANPWGMHDMHGNVWEWCRDWHQDKLLGGTDPEVTQQASARVGRGGSCSNPGEACRSAYRGRNDPRNGYDNTGFRLAVVQVAK